MAGGRPTDYRAEYCERLITHMAAGNSFWSFAAEVDVSFETLSNWCAAHPEFLESKNIGLAKLLKFDEQLALMGSSGQLKRVSRTERLTDEEGNTKEITYHDAAQFAQTYHIFKMKNRYPKFYRDKIEIESSSSDQIKKQSKVIEDVMKDPQLAEAARIIAEKMSDE